jgi:hypothetical protein
MAAATTLPTRALRDGDALPAALLTDGDALGTAGRGAGPARRPELRVASCTVRPLPESLDDVRSFVRRTARDWSVDGISDDLTLVVSELVTNALRHGLGAGARAAGVGVALYGTASRVMCAVSDPSDEVPVRVTPDHTHDSGRGLQIVEALSMYWGWTPLERDGDTAGKSVWAVFPLDTLTPEARAV